MKNMRRLWIRVSGLIRGLFSEAVKTRPDPDSSQIEGHQKIKDSEGHKRCSSGFPELFMVRGQET